MPPLRALLIYLALLVPVNAHATNLSNAELSIVDKSELSTTLTQIAAQTYWRQLLRDPHPKSAHYSTTVSTRAGSTRYFLASHGEQDARAELVSSVNAFSQPWPGASTDNPSCRFPARRQWLTAQLPIQAKNWPVAKCDELDTWLKGLDTGQVTLVFASDYLNNPSSMFGHTLLRLDARTQSDDTRLLAYAINYSAQTNTSNGLEFAWKGLTGGYPGAYSLMPYYEKVKEYNDWESRDLWEYELNLNAAEINTLLLTQWDWRGITAPYYFFSRNCSYELLGLLDMARPGLALQAQFPGSAIPTDTLRSVLAEPGLLKRVTWRSASGTRLQAMLTRNSRDVNLAALALTQTPNSSALETLTATEKAQALETAYDDLYLRYVAHEASRQSTPPLLRQLLVERSQIPVTDQRVAPQQPAINPENGHDTARWGLGYGHDSKDFALLHYRPAYHDWLDSSGGYREGARVDFLDLNLRMQPSRIAIDSATLVGIDSLAPANALHQPLSWSVRLGVDQGLSDRRKAVNESAQQHPLGVFEGGAGLSARLGNNTNSTAICFAESHSDLRASDSLGRGWEIGTGARVGCTGSTSLLSSRWLVENRSMYRWPSQAWSQELRTSFQLPLTHSQALKIEFQREWREQSLSSFRFSWLRYF